MKKFAFPLLLVVIVVALVGLFLAGNNSNSKSDSTTNQHLLGDKHPELARTHIADGAAHDPYNSEMPSSGPHYATPAKWGISNDELPDERVIHNMEHGGIVIAYKPDLAPDALAKLLQLAQNLPKSSQFNEIKVVLEPRSKNVKPVELAAWTYTYNLDSVDEAKITQFYNDHLDKGPELIP